MESNSIHNTQKSPVELNTRHVVTAFLRCGENILIVRRSKKVGSYQGLWSAISGYVEDPTALQQALREIREETGVAEQNVKLIAKVLNITPWCLALLTDK